MFVLIFMLLLLSAFVRFLLKKLLACMQNFTEIEQSAAQLSPNNTILNFQKKIHLIFGHITVIEFQIHCCVANFIKIG